MTKTNRARANALNASKSTGPTTIVGKRISSKNATKHGLAAGQAHASSAEVSPLWQLQRVLEMKTELISRLLTAARPGGEQSEAIGPLLERLIAIDRYERRARAKWTRANQSH